MHERCGARLESGASCRAPGSIPDGTGGLVCYEHADTPPPSLTDEARDLLQTVESGGVPLYATANLARIATENGVYVSPGMTPNDIIEELRRKA